MVKLYDPCLSALKYAYILYKWRYTNNLPFLYFSFL